VKQSNEKFITPPNKPMLIILLHKDIILRYFDVTLIAYTSKKAVIAPEAIANIKVSDVISPDFSYPTILRHLSISDKKDKKIP
jgi:hypothetical protein